MSRTKVESRWKIAVVRGKTGAGIETNCTRCMGCEAICSFMRKREVNPEISRIKVEPRELEWIEGKSNRIITHKICQQCPGITPCMKACPVEGAIKRDMEWGMVLIDDSICTRCQECVKACPFGAVWYDKQNDAIIKCDLCGGKPQCVEWCPVGVLKLVKAGKEVKRGG
jgi:Fe-S-cluster-containing dehydrogenase component